MSPAADISSKHLISLAPERWVHWVTGDETAAVLELPSGEFTWIRRETDVLMKAHSTQHGTFLIVNEIQFRPDARMAVRVRAYAALAEERYGLPVFPVVVNILPPERGGKAPPEAPQAYHSELMGLVAHQDYRVFNLWQVEASEVLAQNWATLLPFVPVMRGGEDERVVRRALKQVRADPQLADSETLLAFVARFVMSTERIKQLMRWDMTILHESPWYNEIVQEGLEKGLQQGLQQGLHEGKVELLLRLLERRFGRVPDAVTRRVRSLSGPQLVELFDIALTAGSLDDVVSGFDTPPPSL